MRKLLLLLSVTSFFFNATSQVVRLQEDFNSSTLPIGWVTSALTGSQTWSFGNNGSAATAGNNNINGTAMAYFDDDSFGAAGNNNTTSLTSPRFDNSSDPYSILKFDYNFREFAGPTDRFYVQVFNGSAWNTVLSTTSNDCGNWLGSCAGNFPSANIDITPFKNQNCQVRFVYDDGDDWCWYVGIDDVSVVSDTLKTIPYFVDFESIGNPGNQLNFSNEFTTTPNQSFNWSTGRGMNVNSITGPANDHTFGTNAGTYMYCNSALGNSSDQAHLTSPEIDISNSTNLTISYWFHMYGFTMGNLRLEVNYGSNWIVVDSLFGQNPNQRFGNNSAWEQRIITLSPTSNILRYRFVGVRGFGNASNMAIDDVLVQGNTITAITENNISASIHLFPNPSNGNFSLEVTEALVGNQYQIFDIKGSVIATARITSIQSKIELINLGKGIFFLKVDGIDKVKKLVIR